MKIKTLFCFLLIFILLSPVLAQSVTISPKKVVYTRKLRNIEKEKKTFDVRYPVVIGSVAPAVKRKFENTISYWRVFETPLKESMEDTYLSNLDYKVNYNKNGIFDISLIQEGVGAYPSTQTVNLVVNLKTGEQVKFNDIFKQGSLVKLAEMVDRKLQAEKARIAKNLDAGKYNNGENNKEENESVKNSLQELNFTSENFNEFSVGDKGVTILYDAEFPHVIQALQPDGRYFFTWAQLKPFIKPDGLLGKFIR